MIGNFFHLFIQFFGWRGSNLHFHRSRADLSIPLLGNSHQSHQPKLMGHFENISEMETHC